MGNNSSWQTVSQKSTGYVDPYVFKVAKRESSALHMKMSIFTREIESYAQTSNFQIFTVHNDIIEAK